MSEVPHPVSTQTSSTPPESSQSANDGRPESKAATEPSRLSFKVYKPPNSSSFVLPLAPLSDDYFVPTAADLKAAQATLNARTRALVDAPLQLRATREAAQKAKLNRWPETTIRIKFPDQTLLESVFPSTDKIRSVYAFVRGCLREDVKPVKFILYQSPPKRDLKVSDLKVRDLSLAELQLSPSSVLLIRFEDESFNHVNVTAPLASTVISQAVDLPIPSPPNNEIVVSASSQRSTPENSLTRPTEKKIPKWLKMGQSKQWS